jgi:hypothetical protein
MHPLCRLENLVTTSDGGFHQKVPLLGSVAMVLYGMFCCYGLFRIDVPLSCFYWKVPLPCPVAKVHGNVPYGCCTVDICWWGENGL